MKSIRGFAYFLLLCIVVPSTANAQTVSGQISGRVVDPEGAVIGGASVRLTSDLTQQVREFVADESGSFVFSSLAPGDYSVHVAQAGFKTYEQKGIHVSAQERLNLRDIKLELGEVATSVTVEVEQARVQTTTADRIQTLSQSTIEGIPMPTRRSQDAECRKCRDRHCTGVRIRQPLAIRRHR